MLRLALQAGVACESYVGFDGRVKCLVERQVVIVWFCQRKFIIEREVTDH